VVKVPLGGEIAADDDFPPQRHFHHDQKAHPSALRQFRRVRAGRAGKCRMGKMLA